VFCARLGLRCRLSMIAYFTGKWPPLLRRSLSPSYGCISHPVTSIPPPPNVFFDSSKAPCTPVSTCPSSQHIIFLALWSTGPTSPVHGISAPQLVSPIHPNAAVPAILSSPSSRHGSPRRELRVELARNWSATSPFDSRIRWPYNAEISRTMSTPPFSTHAI